MTDSFTLEQKLKLNNSTTFNITGVNKEQWALFNSLFISSSSKGNLFVFDTEENAEDFYQVIKSKKTSMFYPGLGSEPYSSIIPSESNLFSRFNTINTVLTEHEDLCIVTTYSALRLKLPPKSFFSEEAYKLSVSDIISPNELAVKLVNLGYQRTPTVEEPGTFSIKGEIVDIYPINQGPVRLNYFDDMVETIHNINLDTFKTDRSVEVQELSLLKTPYSLLQAENILNLRNNIPRPKLSEKEKVSYRDMLFKKLGNGSLFDDYPLFVSNFFKETSFLIDYCSNYNLHLYNYQDSYVDTMNFFEHLESEFNSFNIMTDDQIKPAPSDIYNLDFSFAKLPKICFGNLAIEIDLDEKIDHSLDLQLTPINVFLTQKDSTLASDKLSRLKQICAAIDDSINKAVRVKILFKHKNSLEEIKYILKEHGVSSQNFTQIEFIDFDLNEGFYYKNESLLIISESDFFSQKVKKTKTKTKKSNNDLFADQLSTLNIDDHVIHKQHGVGVYKGIETLELNGSESDYIVLEYEDSDKVYVPVYRLNLLQKHSSNQSSVKIANLKSKKFDAAKTKAKGSIKKLAFDLLELQAKRKMQKGFAFSAPDHMYTDFELSFKFEETPDQKKAIDDVLDDMQSERPMDRLVCGDVGFGKTEVAIRAAFKAILDHKQVGVLVPTTVLAYQHYNTFIERLKDFPVNIEFVSRFKSAKETTQILADLKDGKIDILIGTHKLLSKKLEFKDLGLLVIDEEQRFGVGHKEKLKLMKQNVDNLTLTATPIPRTLQMSFLGIKELSLIQTAPPRRQSIKTYIIKEDPRTIKSAIEKEINRGGQVFIVHNKVHDIEIFTAKIRELAPKARIIYAHGQLGERELEKRISDFYQYKYDILIATTIIESGIDIPRANTMIIDRADTYGLAQLHQLRGRIGRSDKKAYAYFMIPSHKKMSDVATKRLKALQTYAEIGAGFSLATSDLEIRGSGDILGPEQSGHIASVGLELYMELLQEAIHELKGEKITENKNLEIQTAFSSYIPKKYIENSGLRLKYYKKLANASSITGLEDIVDEITDQYGLAGESFTNLCTILKSKIYIQHLGLVSVKVKSKTIDLIFDQQKVTSDPELQSKIVKFFTARPKIYKINPDFSINCHFKDKISQDTLLDFAKHIAQQILND